MIAVVWQQFTKMSQNRWYDTWHGKRIISKISRIFISIPTTILQKFKSKKTCQDEDWGFSIRLVWEILKSTSMLGNLPERRTELRNKNIRLQGPFLPSKVEVNTLPHVYLSTNKSGNLQNLTTTRCEHWKQANQTISYMSRDISYMSRDVTLGWNSLTD